MIPIIYLTNINLNQNELQNAVIQPLASAPSTPRLGQIYCDSTNSRIKWYNGTEWTVVGVVVESSETNGNILVDGVEMSVYQLPTASASILGGIKVGAGLSITAQGVLSATGGGVADSVAWDHVVGKPTTLSEFTNDENFIDNTVNNLVNYYTKTDSYSKTEVNTMISQIATIQVSLVNELPASGQTNIIYLVPKTGELDDNNVKDEYLWTGAVFEKIGSTEIDLTNYLTITGNASSTTVDFTSYSGTTKSLPATGDTLSVINGKILRYLSDLQNVAFTGSYSDLGNKPTRVGVRTYQLDAGQTTVTLNLSEYTPQLISGVVTYDNVTKEVILCDITVNNTSKVVTVTITEAHSNKIDILVSYTVDD